MQSQDTTSGSDDQEAAAAQNLEAEQALLGAIMINNDAFFQVNTFLQPGHFAEPLHSRIFDKLSEFIMAGKVADPITIKHEFDDDTAMLDLGGPRYLAHLAAGAVTVLEAKTYGQIIHDLWQRRAILDAVTDLGLELRGQEAGQASDAIGRAVERLYGGLQAGKQVVKKTIWTAEDIGNHVIDRVNEAFRTGLPSVEIHKTGLVVVDKLIGGLRPGRMIVAGGRPGMGKTGVFLSLARQCAERGHAGAFFTLEQTAEDLTERALSDIAYRSSGSISYKQLSMDDVTQRDVHDLVEANDRWSKIPLTIFDEAGVTVHDIRNQVQSLKRRLSRQGQQLRFVVVDYMQLITPGATYAGNRVNEVSEISRSLKVMAKDEDICVIAISQLSRALEQRNDKRPMMSDLRESGTIEQDADVIIFVYREHYYAQQVADASDGTVEPEIQALLDKYEHIVELIFAKNRGGETGTRTLMFDVPRNALRNLDWRD